MVIGVEMRCNRQSSHHGLIEVACCYFQNHHAGEWGLVRDARPRFAGHEERVSREVRRGGS